VNSKEFDGLIENRTRNLPDYSAVPQPTALPRAPVFNDKFQNFVKLYFVGFECLKATTVNVTVLQDVGFSSLVDVCGRFEEICCLSISLLAYESNLTQA
jgi:hypothetical protein